MRIVELFSIFTLWLLHFGSSLKHNLHIVNDDRKIFKIETFGFIEGGQMTLTLSDFSLNEFDPKNGNAGKIGFIMRKSMSESSSQQDLELIVDKDSCILDYGNPDDFVLDISDPSTWSYVKATHKVTAAGLYSLIFARCHESSSTPVITAPVDNGETVIENSPVSTAEEQPAASGDAAKTSDEEKKEKVDEAEKEAKREEILEVETTGARKLRSFSRQLQFDEPLPIMPITTVAAPTGPVDPLTIAYHANFRLQAEFHNPGPNYLSAGEAPLPWVYFAFFLSFAAATIVWLSVIFRWFGNKGSVHGIHYLMAVLLVLKTLTLLFESIRFHYIAIFGSSETWSIIYFIFAGLKGVMLFTVIMLIGSGWSLMKAYLHEREKQIIFAVLTLQVIDNIAMVVLEETAPGSQGWLTWRDILHLIDIICCCAILFPIVWSIRHLRQAAEIDGKAQVNIQKLQLFRQFYVMVVVYIYFTRLVVLLITATIPFYLEWLGDLFSELATLMFYTATGYQFRPMVNNPYLPVQQREGGSDGEFGLAFEDDEQGDSGSGDFGSSLELSHMHSLSVPSGGLPAIFKK